jgi:hypothetical protein
VSSSRPKNPPQHDADKQNGRNEDEVPRRHDELPLWLRCKSDNSRWTLSRRRATDQM